MSVIEVKNLSFSYDKTKILKDISFSVGEGEILCLLGSNGTGKSTLIKCLARVHPPDDGQIMLDSVDIRRVPRKIFARKIVYIPQSSVPIFPFLVRDLVAMGRTPHKSFFSMPTKSDYELVSQSLESLGISHLEYKSCTDLSGGERQMVFFAAAVVQEPQILLLDEPTSHLDFGNQMKILRVIKQLSAKGMIVLVATHAPEHAFLTGDLTAIMKKGQIEKFGTPNEVITEENIAESFGIEVRIIDVDSSRGIRACVPMID